MISKECFTAAWIDEKSKELQYNDKNIIEKVIRAFSLLDMLALSGCPFHFKGGSCLMLLLKNGRHRLSIDIDIISFHCIARNKIHPSKSSEPT